MKEGKTLVELATELDRQQKSKRDFIAPSGQLAMLANPVALALQAETYPLQQHAHAQLAERLDIPKRYYDRMLARDPELLAKNVNTWLTRDPDERRLVRVLDGQVRAVLSDRYQRIENFEIAETAIPVLTEAGAVIRSVEITPNRMYLKAVFPNLRGEVRGKQVGDVIAGVSIGNSETGVGAAYALPFAEVLKCTNGMTMPKAGARRHHVGARAQQSDEVYELLSDEALAADDKAFLLIIRDVIRACTDEAKFLARIDKMNEAAGEVGAMNPVKTIELLAKRSSFNEDEKSSVLRHLIEGGDLSRWGVINAVTRTAEDMVSYDRASELELLGGQLLELPVTEWRELAAA